MIIRVVARAPPENLLMPHQLLFFIQIGALALALLPAALFAADPPKRPVPAADEQKAAVAVVAES